MALVVDPFLALRQTEVVSGLPVHFTLKQTNKKNPKETSSGILYFPMKYIPYVNSLGEKHVILELGLQELHWRSGKSQKQYYVHDQPRKY